jgi:hypothetical protein
MPHTHIVRRLFALAMLLAATTSCGGAALNGQSPVYLTVVTLTAGTGFTATTLLSSVASGKDDLAQIGLELTPKLVTTPPTVPTSNNQVTLTRYNVAYSRADGQNTPGVGVPYGFDGVLTATVLPGATTTSIQFELVRLVAKEEPPLVQLIENPGTVINTIATVTFYGSDQVGNAVSVAASMSIEFAGQ